MSSRELPGRMNPNFISRRWSWPGYAARQANSCSLWYSRSCYRLVVFAVVCFGERSLLGGSQTRSCRNDQESMSHSNIIGGSVAGNYMAWSS
ncbi:hypothetical protein AVEN_167495-1 [Araneus ventricosus]|uniref:Uncharacterized protein n=1 Tax=Araneus ventricosus TaxID=182803 RepID=A0A4Y2UMU5_ARAVE|nr:hypothetical protein AVEN_167495-1 [Araneus ventricosus]